MALLGLCVVAMLLVWVGMIALPLVGAAAVRAAAGGSRRGTLPVGFPSRDARGR